MSKWLGIVCIVACFGMGCGDDDVAVTDGGPPTTDVPVTMDTGPVVTEDTGPVVTDTGPVGDAGPLPECNTFDGIYGVEPVVGNPAACAAAAIDTCTLETTDEVSMVTCILDDESEVAGECTFDERCVCTGMTTIMDVIPVTIAGDFPNLTLSADAGAVGVCNFTLIAM